MLELTHSFLITTDAHQIAIDDPRRSVADVQTEVVSGFDFSNMDLREILHLIDTRSFVRKTGRLPSPGQVGCALAHRFCYERLAADGGQVAIIFEDDCFPSSHFTETVIESLQHMNTLDLISLKRTFGFYHPAPQFYTRGGAAYKPKLWNYGTHCYLITKSLAVRFAAVNSPKLRTTADWPLPLSKFKSVALHSYVVSFNHRPSQVGYSSKNDDPQFLLQQYRRLIGIKNRALNSYANFRGFVSTF